VGDRRTRHKLRLGAVMISHLTHPAVTAVVSYCRRAMLISSLPTN